MSNISCAIVACIAISIILSFVQVFSETKIKEMRPHLSIQLLFYTLLMIVGNLITTLVASSIIDDIVNKKPSSIFSRGPVWLWYSIVGVFGFETIVQRINISIFDRGLLSISDWITKAKNTAVSATLESASEINLMEKQSLADSYYSLFDDKQEIHTAAVSILGNEKYQKIITAVSGNKSLNIEKHLAYILANEAPIIVKGAIKAQMK